MDNHVDIDRRACIRAPLIERKRRRHITTKLAGIALLATAASFASFESKLPPYQAA